MPGSAALVVAHADAASLIAMDEGVRRQASALALKRGVHSPVHLMPDAHPGFGIPHGSVVGFAPSDAQLLVASERDFDHAFGLRALISSVRLSDLLAALPELAASLKEVVVSVPPLSDGGDPLFACGAHGAVEQGWGYLEDLEVCEDQGLIAGCDSGCIDPVTLLRWQQQLRLPGRGNQQLEIHVVKDLLDPATAHGFCLELEQVVVLLHAGSAGLGPRLARDLAIAGATEPWLPLESELGQRALQCQRIALNCASAFRQVLTHRVRALFQRLWPMSSLAVLCDFSHNSFRLESHWLGHDSVDLWVQRCGAVRAFGPSHGDHPAASRNLGTPVILGGAFGGPTELVCGVDSAEQLSLSTCVWGMGAGELGEHAGLCRRVVRLEPVLSLQG